MDAALIGIKLFLGTICLFVGAEFLIRGGASIALRIGLPILVVGLIVMGYGTGTPELVVSLQASVAGKGDIAIGNVLGSNIANIGLILGFSSLCRPIPIRGQLVKHDGPIMVIVTLGLCLLLAMNDQIVRWQGLVLIIVLLCYTVWSIRIGMREHIEASPAEELVHPKIYRSINMDLLFLSTGFLLLFFGGYIFLDGAVEIAKRFSMSDAVIGLTIVAMGTSLPEFATSIMAIFKKHEDLALGNVVGSNIFNILAIIGLTALFHPVEIGTLKWIDYCYMGMITVFLGWIIRTQPMISRWMGAGMLCSYFVYIGYRVFEVI